MLTILSFASGRRHPGDAQGGLSATYQLQRLAAPAATALPATLSTEVSCSQQWDSDDIRYRLFYLSGSYRRHGSIGAERKPPKHDYLLVYTPDRS
jgi:hypothetical protein